MLEVRAALERWERPALVLFSDSDPIFSTVAAERMASRIPGAGPAEIVAGAGHFLQEEKGEEIAERIVRFLAETPSSAPLRPAGEQNTTTSAAWSSMRPPSAAPASPMTNVARSALRRARAATPSTTARSVATRTATRDSGRLRGRSRRAHPGEQPEQQRRKLLSGDGPGVARVEERGEVALARAARAPPRAARS